MPPGSLKLCAVLRLKRSQGAPALKGDTPAVSSSSDGLTVSAACEVEGVEGVCVASARAPAPWWPGRAGAAGGVGRGAQQPGAAAVVVTYSLVAVERSSFCDPASHQDSQPSYLGVVTLVGGGDGEGEEYVELKEDQHIRLYVPRGSVTPGASFRVPVKLQPANSGLRLFVIK